MIDEDDPERGQQATRTINEFSKLYLGQDVYPLRDPRGGEIRTLYRSRQPGSWSSAEHPTQGGLLHVSNL